MDDYIPKYIPRCFSTLPVVKGKASVDDCDNPIPGYPMVIFKAANNRANYIALKTDEKISADERIANLTVCVIKTTFSDLLRYGGDNLLRQQQFLMENGLFGETAFCTGKFFDAYDCVPPLDFSPPCQNPQAFFGLTDKDGNDAVLQGSTFAVFGELMSTGQPYPEGRQISGTIAMLFETADA